MRKLLISLALALALTGAAHAETVLPYERMLIPGYMMLNSMQQTLFEAAYAAAVAGETNVQVPENMAYEDAAAAMNLLLNECPELCALADSCRILYARSQPDTAVGVELAYARPLDTQATLLNAASSMAAQTEGSAWERELALHDMLCRTATYDLNAPNQSTAYGALVDGRAGCSGYARAMTLLCRLAGIPCQTVSGTARANGAEERHTWCVLDIGGAFTLTDPTWDDQNGLISYCYFNLTDAQMAADHTPDAGTLPLPCTDESLSWYARNGMLVPAEEAEARQMIDGVMERMVREGVNVNLRFDRAEDAEAFANGVDAWIDRYHQRHPETPYEGSWTTLYRPTQNCVTVIPCP
ncbi:MAG: transglutaminase domain-containing protein [Aristaeellaceae bacterium]